MSIHRRWALILAGRSCQTHDPNPGDLLPHGAADYKGMFTNMWIALGA
jgi:hypothetical protein